MRRSKVLIADDHLLTLEGIRTVLETRHDVVGAVTDGRALIDAALRLKPDLIVTDITMPLLNGIDAAVQIRNELRGAKILFVTMHDSPAYLDAGFRAGGSGFVLKSAAREELLDAVDSVLDGRVYVAPRLAAEPLVHDRHEPVGPQERLTQRERETLQLIAEGKATKEIAHILNVSLKTATFHRENIKRKLGLKTSAALTRYAMEQGLV